MPRGPARVYLPQAMFKSVITPEMHYDDWARQYDSDVAGWDYHAPTRVLAAVRPFLSAHLGPMNLLDVGIGTGLLSKKCRALHGDLHITGIDVSAKMLDLCMKNSVADALRRVDVSRERFPFNDGGFDIVMASGVMENVGNAENAIAEMARVTRPGGLMAFTYMPAAHKETERLARKLRTGRTAEGRLVMGDLTLFRHSREKIRAVARRAGTQELSCERFVGYRTYVVLAVAYDLFVAQKIRAIP